MTATVTLHTVLSSKGEAISGYLDPQTAWEVAERIGTEVGTKVLAVGDRVNVRFATHPKTGTIVRFAGKRVIVRLVTRKGGPEVEKSFAIESIKL
jgi:hypothetical protein